MKILLTGPARVGKTTLFRELTLAAPQAFWVVTERTHDAQGIRTGFKAVNSLGGEEIIDRREDLKPDVPMGNHHVDVAAIDRLFSTPIQKALKNHAPLLLIDEIGRIERYSPRFIEAIDQVFTSPVHIIAVIHLSDDWAELYKSHPDALTLTLSAGNRDQIHDALTSIVAALPLFDQLSAKDQAGVQHFAQSYAQNSQFILLKKLFKNAVTYLADGRLHQVDDRHYALQGLTNSHHIELLPDHTWACDCDLFHGRGKFAGQAGECSHIQTIKVSAGLFEFGD
ncbi:MAG: hypothetical protein JWN01_583 [Patescibacteria group bacterium]|nr:hypothetical protein [Patescibacteria group bacterium]